jgi:hypothetical protein
VSSVRHFNMSIGEIQDRKAIAREMSVQQTDHASAELSATSLLADTISIPTRDYARESTGEDELYGPADMALFSATELDTTKLLGLLRQLEVLAKRQVPRIAFKAKGRILFLDVAEIVAVQAEGNYVSLLHPPNPYLLRQSLSSMAEKLRPYGFIRIHRSVVVNIAAVEEIEPLATGEYRLRVRGGNKYLVTRTYKDSLKDLAQLWVGSEHLCS